jgi:CheY-like chemotaxis protein
MLTLIFRSPKIIQERICGPSERITITPEAIYCDDKPTPAAEFRYALWHVSGAHFTSAEIIGPAIVSFQSGTKMSSRQLGPFSGLRIISGYLFDGSRMIARAIAGKWYTYDEDEEFEQIRLEQYEEPTSRPRTRGILVVEDNDIERTGLTTFLRGKGYHVVEAQNGEEALTQLDKQVPELILLDMQMPRVDGWHFLQERREDPELVSVPVVVVTGLANATDAWAENVGAEAVLPKPIHTERLMEKVRQFVPS